MTQAAGAAGSNSPIDPSRTPSDAGRVRWHRLAPSLVIHAGCLGIVWVGWSPVAVAAALGLYVLRMFTITAFYHRYFSHRTFRTSRAAQFVFALIGTSSAQRGPIWWAAHHRDHHRHSDQHHDIHSPRWRDLLWSHYGWIFSDRGVRTRWGAVPDLAKYPELLWLERFHWVGPLGLLALCFGVGAALERWAPGLGTGGAQMAVWGFFVSTTALHHATFTINSLAHTFGSRRFETGDDSRNNWLLAIITLGEGWHNNHHYNPGSVRQGFYWWEIDPAYYGLVALSKVGIVWDLRPVPERVYEAAEGSARGAEKAAR